MATHQPPTEEASCAGLTAFQRDLVAIIAHKGRPYGLQIKRKLEQHRYEEVNHGRLYPNLDTLVRHGFVEKRERDRRTNEYALTDTGRSELSAYESWLGTCLGDPGE
jgi:PadR family transcriptional regulator PadR